MASRRALLPRLVFSFGVVLLAGLGSARRGSTEVTNSPVLDTSSPPPGVGSIDEYVGQTDPFGRPALMPSYVPLLGISVFRSATKLASGEQFSGLAVISVDQPGPGYDAGIRAQRIRATRAAAEVGATVLVLGAAAFFPPAIFGVPLLAQMQSPRAYDVIVAVDAERIQDVSELEYSLGKAKAGETIYLTIVRNGRRVQLRAPMPGLVSTSAPSLPK